MKAIELVDFAVLKENVNALNKLELVDKIKVIGTGKEILVKAFVDGIEAAAAAGKEADLGEALVNFYNDLISDEAAPSGDAATAGAAPAAGATQDPGKPNKEPKPAKEGKPPKEPKPAKPAKEPKPPKEKKERAPRANDVARDAFGSAIGSQANLINEAMLKGANMEALTAACGSTASRVKSHIAWYKTKGFTYTVKDGIYTLNAPAAPAAAAAAPAAGEAAK